MTDWWQYQGNLACTDEQINCRWMVTTGCLPALFNEVSRFILNSAKHFMPFRILLSISSRAVCHADGRRGSWDSHRVAVIVLATAAWTTPVTHEEFSPPGEIFTFPKISLLWLKWHCEIKRNLFLAAVWPYSHANNLGTLNCELIVIYEKPTGNLESSTCHFRS